MTKPETEPTPNPELESPFPSFEDLKAEAELNVAIRRRYELAQEVKELEAEIKTLSAQILNSLNERQLTVLETEDHVASVVTMTRSSLSELKLMARGIPLHVIKDCKEERTSSYLKVGKRTEPDDLPH